MYFIALMALIRERQSLIPLSGTNKNAKKFTFFSPVFLGFADRQGD
jgi:hypothetical protein